MLSMLLMDSSKRSTVVGAHWALFEPHHAAIVCGAGAVVHF